MMSWIQPTTTTVVQEASRYEVISTWGSVISAVFAFGALVIPLYLWYHDRKTHLRISYSIGDPEYPADVNDIPLEDRPGRPALYIKVLNRSKMDVRLNNVFIRDPRGSITFERIGNIATRLEKRTPGDHWLFFQPMSELAQTLKRHDYSGQASINLVVRDGTGREHEKLIEIPDLESWR